MREIKHLIIHHSLTPRDLDINKCITSFSNSHKKALHPKENGYGLHIAYHYVIGGKGEVVKTRPISEIGYHASNWKINKASIGICLVGNFDKETPSDEQYNSLNNLIDELDPEFNLEIYGHNKFAKKTCPGKNFNFSKIIKNNMSIKDLFKPIFNSEGLDRPITEKEVKKYIEIAVRRVIERMTGK